MPKSLLLMRVRQAALTLMIGLGVAAAGRPAAAQVTPLASWTDGKFYVQINSPSLQLGGGRIDCAPRSAGCKPLNLARCTDTTPMPINFNVGPGTQGLPQYTGTSQVLYAFLGTVNVCVYSQITGQTGYNPNLLIGTSTSLASSAPFFSGGTQSFLFPSGVSTISDALPNVAATHQYTVADMLQSLGVCGSTGVQMSNYFLCVGVDVTGSQGINNSSTATATSTTATAGNGTAATASSDPVAYLKFQIDTIAPDPPQITSLKSLNGRCEVDVAYSNVALDLYSVRVKYSSSPENLNVPCNLWTDDVHYSPEQSAYGQSGGSLSFTVDNLVNDTTYAFCAEAEDYMQNVSVPTANVVGEPRFECDLFGCYPGQLKTGYCGQYAAPHLWLGATTMLFMRALRQRRSRSAS